MGGGYYGDGLVFGFPSNLIYLFVKEIKIDSMKNIIIIPTYNEKNNIVLLTFNIFALMPDVSVVVVDDNSPDGTSQAVVEMQTRYPRLSLILREKKEGLGKAYIHAFKNILAQGSVNIIITMDADLSHDPKYLSEMIGKTNEFDVVIGSRYVRGGGTEGWELWRKILSRWANFYCKLITRMPIHDFTAGFQVIKADSLRKIDFSKIDMSGYAFLMELKYLLWKSGAKFTEVPIVFKNRIGGESKISNHIIKEGILAPWKMILKKRT